VFHMSDVTLDQASTIVDKALEHGKSQNFKPLSVVVLNSAGDTIVLKRQDKTSILRTPIATAKAWGALGMGCGSRELERRSKANPAFFATVTEISGGRMVPVAGGVLIRDASNNIIGAVGISGDVAQNDEACAVAGIQAAGLKPDTGDPM